MSLIHYSVFFFLMNILQCLPAHCNETHWMPLMKLPHAVSRFISHSTNVITTLLRVSLQRERNFKEWHTRIHKDSVRRAVSGEIPGGIPGEQPRSNFSAVEIIIIKNTAGGLGTKEIEGMFEGSVSTYIQPGSSFTWSIQIFLPSVPGLAVALYSPDNLSVFENYIEIQCIPTRAARSQASPVCEQFSNTAPAVLARIRGPQESAERNWNAGF